MKFTCLLFFGLFLCGCTADVDLGNRGEQGGTGGDDSRTPMGGHSALGGHSSVGGQSAVGGQTGSHAICGDAKVASLEQCDDGNALADDGCNGLCQIEPGWACSAGLPCIKATRCGDGVVDVAEQCDDGNLLGLDGCSADCRLEAGWTCVTATTGTLSCVSTCGDGILAGQEQCDDENTIGADGCSSLCRIEPGYSCIEAGTICVPSVCGNGVLEGAEQCDFGTAQNAGRYGGCAADCTRAPFCGDGVVQPQFDETCDQGEANRQPNSSACDQSCQIFLGP